jgi:hypothetical protein
MATRHTATLSLLVLTLGAGCYDPDDDSEVQPLPAGPTDEEEASGEGSEGGEDDDDDGEDRGEDDDGEDDADEPSPPPNDGEPTCEAQIGESCEVNGECCGFEDGDALCVNDGVNTICHQTCTSDSECGSGCCGETDTGDGVCVPEVYCEDDEEPICYEPGYACEINLDCCGFTQGDASCVNFAEGLYCSAACTWGSDCNSGCCVALDNGLGACAPDYYCGGAPEEPETELEEATSQSEPNASYERAVSL